MRWNDSPAQSGPNRRIAELQDQVLINDATIAYLRSRLEAEREAVSSRESAFESACRIGIALGMVMTLRGIPEDQALAVLTEQGQQAGQGLLAVADTLIHTGQLPGESHE